MKYLCKKSFLECKNMVQPLKCSQWHMITCGTWKISFACNTVDWLINYFISKWNKYIKIMYNYVLKEIGGNYAAH